MKTSYINAFTHDYGLVPHAWSQLYYCGLYIVLQISGGLTIHSSWCNPYHLCNTIHGQSPPIIYRPRVAAQVGPVGGRHACTHTFLPGLACATRDSWPGHVTYNKDHLVLQTCVCVSVARFKMISENTAQLMIYIILIGDNTSITTQEVLLLSPSQQFLLAHCPVF